jgi:hypothetical protein
MNRLIVLMAATCLSTLAVAQSPPAAHTATDNPTGGQPATDTRTIKQTSTQEQNARVAQERAHPQNPVDECKLVDGRVDKSNAMNSTVCNNSRNMEAQAKRAGNNRDKREVRP